jgi:hypothetical protein
VEDNRLVAGKSSRWLGELGKPRHVERLSWALILHGSDRRGRARGGVRGGALRLAVGRFCFCGGRVERLRSRHGLPDTLLALPGTSQKGLVAWRVFVGANQGSSTDGWSSPMHSGWKCARHPPAHSTTPLTSPHTLGGKHTRISGHDRTATARGAQTHPAVEETRSDMPVTAAGPAVLLRQVWECQTHWLLLVAHATSRTAVVRDDGELRRHQRGYPSEDRALHAARVSSGPAAAEARTEIVASVC